ncbi:MAG: hypothetical protein COB01_04970 [Lutibacter sp.]|nr:MAG: hypothetical protein COB01_04970 [Lutibacter sp.]
MFYKVRLIELIFSYFFYEFTLKNEKKVIDKTTLVYLIIVFVLSLQITKTFMSVMLTLCYHLTKFTFNEKRSPFKR